MKKNLMFTIAALIIFSGCKKEEDETATTPPCNDGEGGKHVRHY